MLIKALLSFQMKAIAPRMKVRAQIFRMPVRQDMGKFGLDPKRGIKCFFIPIQGLFSMQTQLKKFRENARRIISKEIERVVWELPLRKLKP